MDTVERHPDGRRRIGTWSNGKPRYEYVQPKKVKPRNDGHRTAKETNTKNSIAFKTPSSRPNSNTKKMSLFHEFTTQCIGKMHSLGHANRIHTMGEIKAVCKVLEKLSGINSIRSLREHHVRQVVDYMQHKQISRKTGTLLDPSTVYQRTGTLIWMHNGLNTGGHPLSYSDLDVHLYESQVKNPVDFREVLDYLENRMELHQAIAANRPWMEPSDKMAMAFGMRAQASIGTKGDTVRWNIEKGCLELSYRGKPYTEVTPRQLASRYGDPSYAFTARFISKDGVAWVVAEWEKDSLGHYMKVDTKERVEALAFMRQWCKDHPTKSGRCIPDKDPETGKKITKEQAVTAVQNTSYRMREKLGLTHYAYTYNGGRHYDVQRMVERGVSKYEIIRDKGHFSTRKIGFYSKLKGQN